MARSIEEIQADIARTKAEMQLRDQYERGFNQPQTRVGWGSYIVNNDRGLLDQYQNRENQWKNLMEQERFQKAQQLAQQEHTEKLAKAQRLEQAGYNMDEYMKNRSIAAAKYNYALQQLEEANKINDVKAINDAELALDTAKYELDYWNKRTGYTAPVKETKTETKGIPERGETTVEEVPEESEQNLEAFLAESKGKTKFKTDKDLEDQIVKIKSHPMFGQDKGLQEELNRLNGIKSEETINREINNAIDEAIKNKDTSRLPAGYAKRSFDGVPHVAKKDSEGKWVKVRKW